MRFAFVALVAGTLTFLMHRYAWARLIRDAQLPAPVARAATAVLVTLAVSMWLVMPLQRALPRSILNPLAWVAFTWMGLVFLVFVALLATDLVRLGLHVGGVDADPERRRFVLRLLAATTALVATAAGGFGLVSALGAIRVERVKVPLRRLPASMSGLSIVQITDVHIGPTLGRGFLDRVVDQILALSPDLVVITGDLVDGTVEQLREHVAPLGRLRAPHGVFFVTGNHEYYSGVDAWIEELGRLGIRVLRNERVEIRQGDAVFDLAGIDDHSAHQFPGHGADLARALRGRDPTRELVLLAHQPRQLIEAAGQGIGLQISGHTHGGQIFPWRYLVALQQKFVAGLYQHDGAWLYVSRGTGYWGPPMRVGSPAEITRIELTLA